MGYFTKPDAPSAGAPAALSLERVQSVLDAHDSKYNMLDGGVILGYWDAHPFFFLRLGEDETTLQVRGRWNRRVGTDQIGALGAETNKWNDEHIWPKAYVRDEDGTVGVYGEVAVDYTPGVTDEQIDRQIEIGLFATLDLFGVLDEMYPDAVAAAQAEQSES